MQMIKEITFYYPKGNNETYEVGRETPEGTVKKIEVEYNKYYTKAIIFFRIMHKSSCRNPVRIHKRE